MLLACIVVTRENIRSKRLAKESKPLFHTSNFSFRLYGAELSDGEEENTTAKKRCSVKIRSLFEDSSRRLWTVISVPKILSGESFPVTARVGQPPGGAEISATLKFNTGA